jgi:hypothetical protein
MQEAKPWHEKDTLLRSGEALPGAGSSWVPGDGGG